MRGRDDEQMGRRSRRRQQHMWILDVKLLQLLTQSTPRTSPPPPHPQHPHRSTGGAAQWASVPPTLLRHRRGSSAAGVGRVVTRRPHPALARSPALSPSHPPATPSTCEKIRLRNRHRTGRRTHTHTSPLARAQVNKVSARLLCWPSLSPVSKH